MTDKPIIFSAPMVSALLDGRKSMTRRILKASPSRLICRGCGVGEREWKGNACTCSGDLQWTGCDLPKYRVGDRLWVRESCFAEELSRPAVTRGATKREQATLKRTEVTIFDELDGVAGVRYPSDGEWRRIRNTPEDADRWIDLFHYRGRGNGGIGHVVPSIHMPRWASRITLIVTEVRVERLQDISEADAREEGVFVPEAQYAQQGEKAPILAFAGLWDHINGAGAWDANPFVAIYVFKVHRCNIATLSGG